MPVQMYPIKAAHLLEIWISFYGKDDKNVWPREDYSFVKQSCEAMRLAIELLREKKANVDVDVKRAAAQLRKWPKVHSMRAKTSRSFKMPLKLTVLPRHS